MALVISDRIKETTNTVGTQTYQLEGAVTGFETFAANLSDGDTTYYAVTDNTNFEVGLGTINEGTSQTINYTVTVANVGGINVFVLNGVNNPVITFVKGFTYVFDVSDNTNGAHPLRFRTSADASYTDGVSVSGTQGQSNATVTIVVASDAPSTLKYYCTSHGNAMGNTINVISAVATLARTTILASSNSNNAVSFGSGAKTIFCTLPAGKAVIKDASNNINGTFVGNITGNVTGNVTSTGNITLQNGTNSLLRFLSADGTSQGYQLKANISNSADFGLLIEDMDNNDIAKFLDGGECLLTHNHNTKFQTTATGATVTGTLVADGVTLGDSETITFGTGTDTTIRHTGSRFEFNNATGGILVTNNANDSDITIQTDDGSGGVADYFRADGSTGEALLYHYGTEKIKTTSDGATVTGNATISSTANSGPVLNFISNDHSDAADFDNEGIITFKADNDADEQIIFAQIRMVTGDITDGTEDGRIVLGCVVGGSLVNAYQFAGGRLFLENDSHSITWNNTRGTSFDVDLITATPTASRTITLPDATGTVLTTGNSDTPTTTTSSSDADFVLIDDGGTMKKITPTNLGITTGGASLDDATALAIALG